MTKTLSWVEYWFSLIDYKEKGKVYSCDEICLLFSKYADEQEKKLNERWRK